MLPAAPRFAPAGAREAPAVLVRRDGTTMPATVRWVSLDDGLDGETPGSVVVVGRATAAQGLPLGDDGYRSVVEALREGVVVHARRRRRSSRATRARSASCASARRRSSAATGRTGGRCARTAAPSAPATTPTAVAAATGRPQADVVMGLHTGDGRGALDRRERRAGARATTAARPPWSRASPTSPSAAAARSWSTGSGGSSSSRATRCTSSTRARCASCRSTAAPSATPATRWTSCTR